MALSMECLLYKHRDLKFIHRTCVNIHGRCTGSNPNPGEAEAGGSLDSLTRPSNPSGELQVEEEILSG